MSCKICEARKPRRYCPGVRGEICAPCCGVEREVTVDCPFDCEYLIGAREHERLPEIDPDNFPNKDIRVSESFLRDNEGLTLFAGRVLAEAALATPGAVDFDVRAAVEAIVRTYRTLESGLYYETRPSNVVAGAIQQRFQAHLQQYRQEAARTGRSIRDADVLGVLVFLQRVEIQHNNGRRRGRAFLHFLADHFAESGAARTPDASPLIVP